MLPFASAGDNPPQNGSANGSAPYTSGGHTWVDADLAWNRGMHNEAWMVYQYTGVSAATDPPATATLLVRGVSDAGGAGGAVDSQFQNGGLNKTYWVRFVASGWLNLGTVNFGGA